MSVGSSASLYSAAGGKGDYAISGEVLLAIMHVGGQLEVKVCRARYLAASNKQGYSNAYIKTYLLPDKTRSTKLKTSVKKKCLNPVYNEVLKVCTGSSFVLGTARGLVNCLHTHVNLMHHWYPKHH